ncbi:Preprotein translocase subunit Sec66 [Phaffia rhodozyma]|uniref:Preprotein translocase subunit Sec66 n=1 Tax=Phaffia rhodozyma TaxID=264483 RepID=A0A0F7ST46_PHARH|nr:Preprotein translocase subunit Sec66 [Phaffia rhodozyma]
MVAIGLLAPLAYAAVLITALGIFSRVYRRRIAAKAETEPWFPSHTSRDLYVSLLQADPAPPEALLKSALLVRAMNDVRRILKIRDDKPALQILIQKGCVGDDLWARFLKAEKELEAEILDVVNEANTFSPAWGPTIFATASEMVQREKARPDWECHEKIKSKAARLTPVVRSTTKSSIPLTSALESASSASSVTSAPTTPVSAFSPVTPTKAPLASAPTTPSKSETSAPATPSKDTPSSAKKGKKKK